MDIFLSSIVFFYFLRGGGRCGGDEEGVNSVSRYFSIALMVESKKGAYLSQYSRNLLKSESSHLITDTKIQ